MPFSHPQAALLALLPLSPLLPLLILLLIAHRLPVVTHLIYWRKAARPDCDAHEQRQLRRGGGVHK